MFKVDLNRFYYGVAQLCNWVSETRVFDNFDKAIAK